MAKYKVKFLKEGKEIEVDENEYILDAAEKNGIDIEGNCRVGTCMTCVSKLHSGKVDQSEQEGLSDDEVAQGFILVCVAKPKSDCVVETGVDP